MDTLEQYMEMAQFAERPDISEQLLRLQETLRGGKYLVAFMGQFSSGKSTLINTLLGSEVLPTEVTETTALITYILYGENEHAELVYTDGSVQECTIDEAKKLWQGGFKGFTSDELAKYDSIRIFVPSSLLQNGMILADTPGINTVFQPHIEKTVGLLESANRVVYVMAKSLTVTDEDFLRCVTENGIDIMMVRTWMDLISSTNENIDDTIAAEQNDLIKYTADPVFFVSNRDDSSFYAGTNHLREYLRDEIASRLQENLARAADNRMAQIVRKLLPALEERRSSLSMLLENEENSYRAKVETIQNTMTALSETLKKNQTKLKDEFASAKSEARKELRRGKDAKADSLNKKIAGTDFADSNFDWTAFSDGLEDSLKHACAELRERYVSAFDTILGENSAELKADLAEIADGRFADLTPPQTLTEAEEASEAIRERIDALLSLEDAIQTKITESEEKIAQGEQDYLASQNLEEELRRGQERVRQELASMGEYVPHYRVEYGNHRNEAIMSSVGRMADIATILIPGEAWAKAATGLMKGSKAAVSAFKSLDLVTDTARIINTTQKGEEALEKARIIRERGEAAQRRINLVENTVQQLHARKAGEMEQQRELAQEQWETPDMAMLPEDPEAYAGAAGRARLERLLAEQERKPSLLDFLSIEYYFSRIGKHFDTPDTVVEDEAYRVRYENMVRDIRFRHDAAAQKAAEERIRGKHILDTQAQQEERKKALEIERKSAEREISELKERSRKEAYDEKNRKCRKHYTDSVNSTLNDFTDSIRDDLDPSIERKMEKYLDTYGLQLKSEIAREKDSLDRLQAEFDSSDKAAYETALQQCVGYLSVLREGVEAK